MKITRFGRRIFKPAVALFAGLAALVSGCSESTPGEYPSRDIKIIIPYNAGGGFDTYIRALVPWMEKHLPGNANVLPINTPGAGGRRGASDVYRAEPDGYTLGVFNMPGVLLPQLQGMNVAYDLSRISWLATLSVDAYALIVKGGSALDSITDVKQMNRPIVYGATGPSSTSYITTKIVSESLQIPHEIVTGYKGSSEYIIGVIRGDIDAAFANLSTVQSYLDSGDVKALAIIGTDSTNPAIQDAADLGIPELGNINVTRMVGGPPGLPQEIRDTLEDAILAALADPGFQDWLEKTGNDVAPAGAEATSASITEMEKLYEKFKQYIQ